MHTTTHRENATEMTFQNQATIGCRQRSDWMT